MAACIASSAIRTCLGNGAETFQALINGISGVAALRHFDATPFNVTHAYQIPDEGRERWFNPSCWLAECVRSALSESGVSAARQRVAVIVGTGLRELRSAERAALEDCEVSTDRLHFEGAVRAACPDVAEVITLSNACSAGGHALALAQDLIESGEADAAVAASTDGLTASMLAMIGRFASSPTPQVRPFDRERTGALLGEGAAALVVVPDGSGPRCLARLVSTGLSCDAVHETVPDADGVFRAVEEAFARGRRQPSDVDLVVAHGTGTILNDPNEARLLRREFEPAADCPPITAIKGAIGHTSGSAALMSVDVAIRCLDTGVVPPIVGLRQRLAEGEGLPFVTGSSISRRARLAQINAFGFGGVNAVTLVEAAT